MCITFGISILVILIVIPYSFSRDVYIQVISFVDNAMIPIYHNLRRYANKVFKLVASNGKGTMGWCPDSSFICCITTEEKSYHRGNIDDRNPQKWKVLAKELFVKIFVNRGYIPPKLFDTLFDDGIQLVFGIKSNIKNNLCPILCKRLHNRKNLRRNY